MYRCPYAEYGCLETGVSNQHKVKCLFHHGSQSLSDESFLQSNHFEKPHDKIESDVAMIAFEKSLSIVNDEYLNQNKL
jgi:hypothetical protein